MIIWHALSGCVDKSCAVQASASYVCECAAVVLAVCISLWNMLISVAVDMCLVEKKIVSDHPMVSNSEHNLNSRQKGAHSLNGGLNRNVLQLT